MWAAQPIGLNRCYVSKKSQSTMMHIFNLEFFNYPRVGISSTEETKSYEFDQKEQTIEFSFLGP